MSLETWLVTLSTCYQGGTDGCEQGTFKKEGAHACSPCPVAAWCPGGPGHDFTFKCPKHATSFLGSYAVRPPERSFRKGGLFQNLMQ